MAVETAPEEYLLTDFPQIGQPLGLFGFFMKKPYQHFYENYTAKPIVNYHFGVNSMMLEINGRINLYPGMSIYLELYKIAQTLSGNREIDKERSGRYIVTGVSSTFNDDLFKQSIMITKGGLS